MSRLTRTKDEYECRMSNPCPAEDWMHDTYGLYPQTSICDDCPFEKYINKLAEYEDKNEHLEDDGK